jgi:hypothetical protein
MPNWNEMSDEQAHGHLKESIDGLGYQLTARALAQRFSEDRQLASRWFCFAWKCHNDERVIALVDNNLDDHDLPYRLERLGRLRNRVAQLGLREVAFSSWPTPDPEMIGDTIALLFLPFSPRAREKVEAMYAEELDRTRLKLVKD